MENKRDHFSLLRKTIPCKTDWNPCGSSFSFLKCDIFWMWKFLTNVVAV